MKAALAILIFTLACIISESNGLQCEEENFLGFTKYKQCPGPNDPEDYQFCCGTKERRYCCNNFLNLDEDDLEEIAKSLPAIIGTIIAVAFGLIVICIICCCCCPFCLLHKRRTRGTVHNPPPGGATYYYHPAPVQAQLQPMMNAPPPQQTYGPPQPAPYPQAPYPTQGYQPSGAAPPAGFAPAPSSAPYPTQPADQPPPADGHDIFGERLNEEGSYLVTNKQVLQKNVLHSLARRDTSGGPTETPIDPKTVVTQEGFRDDVRAIKDKVKDKVNGTITSTKDKFKQKVKDKVQKKIEEKLDPTGGYLKLPAIIGIVVGVVAILIISCIACCCCCPYCILYKKRQASNEKYEPAEVQLQPLRKTDDYNLTSQDYNNENGTENA